MVRRRNHQTLQYWSIAKPENLVSDSLTVLKMFFFFWLSRWGFTREHLLSGYSAIKLWLAACHRDGWPSELFSHLHLHSACLEFSQIWVLGLLSLSLGKSPALGRFGNLQSSRIFLYSFLDRPARELWRLFLWTLGLVFTLICFYSKCVLHPRCRSISATIKRNGRLWHLNVQGSEPSI